MKLDLYKKGILPMVLVGLLMASCLNQAKEKRAESAAGRLSEREFRRELEQINPGLRDPAAVIELIRKTGAGYREDLVNTLGMDSIYLLDTALSALNLGIYTVDIAYLASYEKHEALALQMSRARALAINIGAGHLYDHGMFRRYQAAGIPADTLLNYLRYASEQMAHEFSQGELNRVSTLFTTGEFIEKLHLTTRLLMQPDHVNDEVYHYLMLLLFHQEITLRQLTGLLEQVRRWEEGERFMAMLGDLQLIFMELNEADEQAGINTSNLRDNQIFKDLVSQVGRIRNQITDPAYP